ncbi:MAG: DUF5069 domain-containing protein [bacterium]|jgi:hypothetical protein|nr:DUF5069 domain-containing protein [bacterium]
MAGIVPLISSGVAGPLGVLHLPRLWCKAILGAKGKLAAGYDNCGAGYDQMVLDALGLDREKTLTYLTKSVPTYPAFEKWILDQKGGKLDQQAISKLNDSIRGYHHDDGTRKTILGSAGIADKGTLLDAVMLNNLDDWTEFHSGL